MMYLTWNFDLTRCEVQFDYGLRQRRSRPIETRPKSFTSSSGKKISVAKSVAAKNDVRTKQGRVRSTVIDDKSAFWDWNIRFQAVHKELEREIRQEELKVEIHSEEERWAIRFVSSCLRLGSITSVLLAWLTSLRAWKLSSKKALR